MSIFCKISFVALTCMLATIQTTAAQRTNNDDNAPMSCRVLAATGMYNCDAGSVLVTETSGSAIAFGESFNQDCCRQAICTDATSAGLCSFFGASVNTANANQVTGAIAENIDAIVDTCCTFPVSCSDANDLGLCAPFGQTLRLSARDEDVTSIFTDIQMLVETCCEPLPATCSNYVGRQDEASCDIGLTVERSLFDVIVPDNSDFNTFCCRPTTCNDTFNICQADFGRMDNAAAKEVILPQDFDRSIINSLCCVDLPAECTVNIFGN